MFVTSKESVTLFPENSTFMYAPAFIVDAEAGDTAQPYGE